VKLDGEEIWRSRVLRGNDGPVFAALSVRGAKKLEFSTDPDGDDNSDHTDWLNAYIKLR
jgi:hypothetical protein